MGAPSPDEVSTLVIRMIVTRGGELRIRLIALSAANGERVLGTVTSAAAATALVRGWIDAAVGAVLPEAVSRPDSALDR